MSFPVRGRRYTTVIGKLHKVNFQPPCYHPYKVFLLKAKFVLYIFVFHVLDGSISYPVWIKRTVVVNYYKANDISWQVIVPSCACWFFPWLYCFYKCTNSYRNDETLVCTALTRTSINIAVPSVDSQFTASCLELGTHSSKDTRSLLYQGQEQNWWIYSLIVLDIWPWVTSLEVSWEYWYVFMRIYV